MGSIGAFARAYEESAGQSFSRDKHNLVTELLDCPNDILGMEGFSLADRQQWWAITVGSASENFIQARSYPDILDTEGTIFVSIKNIKKVPGDVQLLLAEFAEAKDIPSATTFDMERVLNRLPSGISPYVAVYDVGQGSCNGLCYSGVPFLYHDLGWPLNFNKRSAPAPHSAPCFSNNPPVVLSHWDFDHWLGARLPANKWHQQAISADWIAPRQYMTPNHSNLLNMIVKSGKIFLWDHLSGPAYLDFDYGRLALCGRANKLNPLSGHHRNDTGIALFATTDRPIKDCNAVLLPGDSSFPNVPYISEFKLVGLVASHHGTSVNYVPKSAAINGKLALSVGGPNVYGHPKANALATYTSNGWSAQFQTTIRHPCCNDPTRAVGGIHLSLNGMIHVHCPPCGGSQCMLCLRQ